MTILVTGATGMVGARLLPRLLAGGFACRALVRGAGPIVEGVTYFDGDLLRSASLVSAVAGVSAIIHLAALLRSPDGQQIWRTNVEGTRNLIDAAKAHAPNARFIMASTGLVYNANISRPAREDDLCEPNAPYPASKIAAETLLKRSGLTWSIQRFGFVYGDKDGHITAVPRLAGLFGWHPATSLSLIHHRDIASAMSLALGGGAPLSNPWAGRLDGALGRSLGFLPLVRTARQSADDGTL